MTIVFAFSSGRRILGSVGINQGFTFLLMNILNPPSMAPTNAFAI